MDDTVFKIAVAAFLHDIGKFAERAGMELSTEYLDGNAALYQPSYRGRYTHKHAVYTAGFLEKYKDILPGELNMAGWGDGDPFINLAAMHHKPETPLQWIITTADRVSSGMDRAEFEEYAGEVSVRDYRKTRLLPILEGLRTDDKWLADNPESYKYRYPLSEISPTAIFPFPWNKEEAGKNEDVTAEYRALFDLFLENLGKLYHREYIRLWFEHFDSLFRVFASHIPAATVGRVIPDVSLYDHCKTTAAIAVALYLYCRHKDRLREGDIRNDDERMMLCVTGDFYGIQDFIFSEGGSTNRASAKLLRGRSFAVSLLSELAAHMLCEEAGLPLSSVVLNAAGKFMAILPNTEPSRKSVENVERDINAWLTEHFFGEVTIGLSAVETSCGDFLASEFEGLWERISLASDRRKHHKVDLERYGGAVSGYLDKFNNDLDRKLCPFCGKRPSSARVEGDQVLGDTLSSCAVCRDHIYLGTNLVKTRRMAVVDAGAEIRHDRLSEPVFGRYQLSLNVEGKLDALARKGELVKYWDISRPGDAGTDMSIALRPINGYVPVFTADDRNDEMLERIMLGKKSDKKMNELFDLAVREEGQPKPFNWLARMAPSRKEDGTYWGIEALGVLKADIDHLGVLFTCGIRHSSLSRLSTLSRQVNNYFSLHIPFILSTRKDFNDIYTVFAGGDDLFLIGPWNRIVTFARFLRESFSVYACRNRDVTISAGIFLCKPGEPVFSLAEGADNALGQAKNNDRDSVTLFGLPVKWETFDDLETVRSTMAAWMEEDVINNAMFYRFNEFIDMAGKEKELRGKGAVRLEEMECFKWKARFKYTLARNVAKRLKGQARKEAVAEVERMAQWLDSHGYAMRIPLWQILYNQR